jgi:hypothetical protein
VKDPQYAEKHLRREGLADAVLCPSTGLNVGMKRDAYCRASFDHFRIHLGPAAFPVPVSRSLRKSSARREQKSPYRERISKEFVKPIDDVRAGALASALLRIAVIPRG